MSPLLLLLLALPALSYGLSCPYGKLLDPNSGVPPIEECGKRNRTHCIKGIVELEKDGKVEVKHSYGCEDTECDGATDKACMDVTYTEYVQKMFKKMNGTGKVTLCCSKDGKFD